MFKFSVKSFLFEQEQQELMERMNQEKQTLPATSLARGLFGRRFWYEKCRL